ncbi:hypothetical protein H310_12089 [Aphanomyces invadans]|uniref:Alpha-ketoglutarate-dependent dioxygenase AlkB-like domain-containing protein n=1 Tax=Aphanomyces invadans TaxID=157072 RepID=A0A024TIR2_9STRA|nr:hypothetical protein H310_12089 [Aphanomyces invadans]ETV94055.1 hypothetical protein H310_12089 [Aphanomyces invadans]|eukprot:XP_008877259.1 hypothetical protein H310_12089 [Aphanomyces invadans]
MVPLRMMRRRGVTHAIKTCVARAFSTSYSWQDSHLVDRSMCHDEALCGNDLQVMEDVLSEHEERVLADEAAALLRRRRYEVNHWDQVIINFKEMETIKWSQEAADILARVRKLPILPQDLEYFPAVHVIDLAAEGYIKPHVDSIKFSGQVVAGLNLLSPAVMRFQEEHGDSRLDLFLPRRSFYCMRGGVRYRYTHEILPGIQVFQNQPVERTRRISIMMRDVNVDTPMSP